MTVSLSCAARRILCRRQDLRRHKLIGVMGVLNLWARGKGLDTLDIASRLGIPEPDVCLMIQADRDRRLRRDRAA